jgi:hypothetical protein
MVPCQREIDLISCTGPHELIGTGGGVSASGDSSPITVAGLTNGQAYSCTVTATNSVDTSSASSAVSGTPEEFTPSGLPVWLLYEATKE